MKFSAFTDGSCSGTIGGFGVVFVTADRRIKKITSKRYTETTNNRMELKALIKVLEHCKPGHNIDIYSDSQYCVKGANEWLDKWLAKGILNTKQNSDLWLRFKEAIKQQKEKGSTINITWVRGHGISEFNKIADKLANDARLRTTDKMTVLCKANN